jgi:hypothetical protein
MKEQIISEGKEALERALLLMKYDSKKTLTENKQAIFEQPASITTPTSVGLGTLGAGAGYLAGTGYAAAAAASAAASGAAIGTATFPVVGTAIGALLGLGLGALSYWISNKDRGADGFKKIMEGCNTKAYTKLVPQLSKSEVRSIAYSIEDSKGTWDDDEDMIIAELQKIPTIADLCAVNMKIPGGLYEFLDDLTDDPAEWKLFLRPIEGMIEDTDMALTPTEQEKAGVAAKDGKKGGGSSVANTMGYKLCTGKYVKGCKSPRITELQNCLGTSYTGKNDIYFGDLTQAALKANGYENGVTDADIDKICNKEIDTPVVDSDSLNA